jgi:membrane protein
MLGSDLFLWLGGRAGLDTQAVFAWRMLRFPLAFVLVATAIALVYYYGPDVEQDFVWITPGSIVATALWIAVSAGFSVYVSHFTDYTGTYGAIGGVIVLMLWFYLSGVAILVGAEINSEIEHASPYGKAPGEKKPGERRVIGRRARLRSVEGRAAR